MNLYAISISRKKFINKYGCLQAFGRQKLNQMWQDDAVDTFDSKFSGTTFEEVATFQKEQQEKLSMKKILITTLILTTSLLSVYIYALII